MMQKVDPNRAKNPSAAFMERLVFGRRPIFLAVFSVITLLLFLQMIKLRPEASFEDMIPTYHPFIANYIEHKDDLKGLGNVVRIAVETTGESIYDARYLAVLQKISDEVLFIPGVDRSALKSLWTPNTRWLAVTENGFDGGQVIPDTYDGSPSSLARVRLNVLKSGEVGKLVASNHRSTIIYVPLLERNPDTGDALDYRDFSQKLETLVREKYQREDIRIYITGFAKIVGDLIEGSSRVFLFFVIAFIILLAVLLFNSGCWRSTAVRGISSLVAVVWQMGILSLFGYGLNPYSMLVPFLMFALGVSHGIQMFNAMAYEMLDGTDKLTAARRAYRSVYVPGLAALFTDCIGFTTLFVIMIGVIQDIAVGASIGVAVVAFTDLMLLPVLMSYSGISDRSLSRLRNRETGGNRHPLSAFLSGLTRPKAAAAVILAGGVFLVWGTYVKQDLKIGDLDPGAPELRPDSRYNLDNAFMTENYASSSDIFVVTVKTPPEKNGDYRTLVAMERLQWRLEHLPGVQSTTSIMNAVKLVTCGFNEGNLKWKSLVRNQQTLDYSAVKAPPGTSNHNGTLSPILVYLNDHKAETLEAVVALVEDFAAENNGEVSRFLMAAGNAGIEAATNIEVEKAQFTMTLLVYGVVLLVCTITFRSIPAALCVVIPLYLTSVLCEAMMTMLGIGIKVATLPVIAVGVGVGVDYGIYIFNKLRCYLNEGYALKDAYYHTLITTGRAVTFTGITLSIGVATWAFSPIKFQADMGILLTFMFLVNMVGALVLLPALAGFLLRAKRKDFPCKRAVQMEAV